MIENDSQVTLSIELDNEGDEIAVKRLLSSFPIEEVVLKTLLEADIKQHVQVALLLTSNETIHALNKQYRGQDKPTDILSFPLLEKPIVSAPTDQLWQQTDILMGEENQSKQAFVTPPNITLHLGDLVISWPLVMQQALEAGHDPVYELLFLLSHGVLHLIGYDDQTEAGYQAMIRLQQAVMQSTVQKK